MTVPEEKESRIYLVNPPSKRLVLRDYYCCTFSKTGYLWQPVDLLVQSGILSEQYSVGIIDAVAEKTGVATVIRTIRDAKPEAVYSLIGSKTIETDLQFLKTLKSNTGATIIVSGDVVLHKPAVFIEKHDCIDAVLLDFTTRDIVYYLHSVFDEISGMVFRTEDGIISKIKSSRHEFKYPFPLHSAFPSEKYSFPFAQHGYSAVLASFGCPFSCAFCNSGVKSIGFSFRDFDNLTDEISGLYEKGVRHIFFKDMTFGTSRSRREKLCSFLSAETRGLTWNTYARVDLLDEETIKMYSEAGCRLLQMGIETADADMAAGVGKKFDMDHVRKTFASLKRNNIAIGAHYIVGLPGEVVAGAMKTLRLARRLDSDYASFNLYSPRPGSSLYDVEKTRKRKRFVWKQVFRLIYIMFYLRPGYIFASLRKGKAGGDERNINIRSMMNIISYILYLPDE